MAAMNSKQPPVWMSTHPSHESRIADMEAHLPGALAIYEKSARAPVAALERVASRSQVASFAAGTASVKVTPGPPLRETRDDGRKAVRFEFSFDTDVHLLRIVIIGPGLKDVIETTSGVPAGRAKHVTLVRKDTSRPDFPAGDYTSTFEGSVGGRSFTASCIHRVP
jgi:hypothetical protein